MMQRTCDSCAEGPKEVTSIGDAYVCADCLAFNEQAIDAGTDAVLKEYVLYGNLHGRARELARAEVREILAAGFKAYAEYTDEGRVTDDA